MLENLLKLKNLKVLEKQQQSGIKGAGICADPEMHYIHCHKND
ncbi:hypothetical protein [uncultured Aquimarina sp.]|nr:hypothetical protein [uncultured Aquimarina sp.]